MHINKCPLISVVVLTHNRPTELDVAIKSVLEQTYGNIELIIIDNCSYPPVSSDIINKFKVNNRQIRLISLTQNVGCPAGRNIGINASHGKIIVTIDDDGWLDKHALDILVRYFEEMPLNVGVLRMQVILIHEILGKKLEILGNEKLLLPNFTGGASAFRNVVFTEAGLYPNDFWGYGEEYDLSLRILDRGFNIIYIPEAIFYHKPAVRKNDKLFIYYNTRNALISVVRLHPLGIIIPMLMWYGLSWMKCAISLNSFKYYLKGVFDFLLKFPSVISVRTPVKYGTLAMYMQLRKSLKKC